jgi:hypothetical protein
MLASPGADSALISPGQDGSGSNRTGSFCRVVPGPSILAKEGSSSSAAVTSIRFMGPSSEAVRVLRIIASTPRSALTFFSAPGTVEATYFLIFIATVYHSLQQ